LQAIYAFPNFSQSGKIQDICHGHAGVHGNEQADKLAGSALVKGKLQYD